MVDCSVVLHHCRHTVAPLDNHREPAMMSEKVWTCVLYTLGIACLLVPIGILIWRLA